MQIITTTPIQGQKVKPLYRGTQIVWYILGVIELILAFRFLLKLASANPGAGFTEFIYSLSAPFASPFINVLGVNRSSGNVFEWGTILAMVVYYLVAWGIVRLLVMGKPVSAIEAETKLRSQDVVE